MTLPEYIKSVEINVNNYGGNGSIVYTASASSGMIYSYNLLCVHTNLSKRKNPPIPILVTSKSTDDLDETFSCFKFAANDINLNTLNKAIHTNCIFCKITHWSCKEYIRNTFYLCFIFIIVYIARNWDANRTCGDDCDHCTYPNCKWMDGDPDD